MAEKPDFKAFYDRHLDRVYRYVFFRVGCRQEVAEDLTSEIFIKALKAFDRYDPEQSQSAWIMMIAKNTLINHYRDRKEEVDVDELASVLPGVDGRVEIERREKSIVLERALATLSAHERQLIELKYLLGYEYQEMAKQMAKSTAAIKMETHRIMKKLRAVCISLSENSEK
jgi:RNA polymerase sigma-70 factor (ECF subfamily)